MFRKQTADLFLMIYDGLRVIILAGRGPLQAKFDFDKRVHPGELA